MKVSLCKGGERRDIKETEQAPVNRLAHMCWRCKRPETFQGNEIGVLRNSERVLSFTDFFFGCQTTFNFSPNHCKRNFEWRILCPETSEVEVKADITGISRDFVAVEKRARGHRSPALTEPGRFLSSFSFLSATFINDAALCNMAGVERDAANVENQPK